MQQIVIKITKYITLLYCGFRLSGQNWFYPIRLTRFCLLRLNRLLITPGGHWRAKIEAKFAVDTGEPHKKELLPKT